MTALLVDIFQQHLGIFKVQNVIKSFSFITRPDVAINGYILEQPDHRITKATIIIANIVYEFAKK